MNESVFVPPEYSGAILSPIPRIESTGPLPVDVPIEVPEALRGRGLEGALIGLDVDGTLVSHGGVVERELLEGLHSLEDRGAHLVIATGRSIPAAMPMVAELGLKGEWVICSNGSVTIITAPTQLANQLPGKAVDSGYGVSYAVVDQVTFDPTQAIDALRKALPHARIGVEAVGRGFRVSRPFPQGELMGEQIVQSFDELKAHPVSRVIARAPEMDRDSFYAAVASAGFQSVRWDIGHTSWVDISPPNTTKARALKALAHSLGTPQERCVAMGDGTNDIPMIRWAGWGIAMGQAVDSVKEAADFVSSPIDQGGARRVVEALLHAASPA